MAKLAFSLIYLTHMFFFHIYPEYAARTQGVSPGRVAQSVGHLTHKSGVLGLIPGLATYFRFSFRFFQEGQLSVTGESMSLRRSKPAQEKCG